MSKPFIKYIGGKTQLLPELFNLFPKSFGMYYEPFLGGGAVFFAIVSSPEHTFEKAILNDWNLELVNAYQVVRNWPELLKTQLESYRASYLDSPEEFYYKVRAKGSTDMSGQVEMAARTIFLNKCGFNGLYRVNKSGKFNVPWGKHKNPALYDPENLEACSEALKRATLSTGDFSKVTKDAVEGDLVYLDPPYVPLNPTSNFTSYTSDGFTMEDQRRLAEEFIKLSDHGVTAFLSNSDTPFIRDLYAKFEIVTVSARRNVNSKGSNRGAVNEVIVTSKRV